MVKLSLPIIAAQVGHVLTGIVDNYFLGKIGKTEQAAGILSNNLFVILLVFSIGMSFSMTPQTADAHVAHDDRQKAALFKNGLLLNLLVGIVLFILLFISSPLLGYMGQEAEVVKLAVPFFDVLIFSIIPISVFFTCKQYCEGLSNTRAAMYISIVGNLLNIILNYLLIYGKCGLPAMGYMGSCWATFIARTFMGLSFLAYVFNRKAVNSFRVYFREVSINTTHFFGLLRMGIGFAMQSTFEVTAFAIAGIMSGVFGKESLDSHGIALSMAAFTFMFASGLGAASTIQVSTFAASKDKINLKLAVRHSFKLVLITMSFMALMFVLLHNWLPSVFSKDPAIIDMASNLMLFAAMFQLFDGMQVVAISILRGLEDVRYPTGITFFGYWLIALPLAYFFGFEWHMEVYGIWLALSISLLFVSVCLFFRIRYLLSRTEKLNL